MNLDTDINLQMSQQKLQFKPQEVAQRSAYQSVAQTPTPTNERILFEME